MSTIIGPDDAGFYESRRGECHHAVVDEELYRSHLLTLAVVPEEKAIDIVKQKYPSAKHLVVSGGVAANTYLRNALKNLADESGFIFAAPPIKYCTDNGVMIAWAGLERFQKGYTSPLDFKPRPRWPLDEFAPKAAGAGGVKA